MIRTSLKGFSLVELLVVIMIIATLAVISVPSIVGLTNSRTIQDAAYRLAGGMELARAHAMTQKTYVRVSMAVDNNGVANGLLLVTLGSNNGELLVGNEWGDATKASYVNKPQRLDRVDLDQTLGAATDTDITAGSFNPFVRNILSKNFTFIYNIEFNPQGEARIDVETTRFIKIGIRLSANNAQDNVAVLRLQGLTGRTVILRKEDLL
jgi:prepilin-type N-terminal cleavage/methylation domain-containing protein